MSVEQLAFYQQKLAYETDSWDLYVALQEGQQVVVVDGRSDGIGCNASTKHRT
jgi:hypothetical protein